MMIEPGSRAQGVAYLATLRLVQAWQGSEPFLEALCTHGWLHGEDDTAWTVAQLDSSKLVPSERCQRA